jgi:hypothetical protein
MITYTTARNLLGTLTGDSGTTNLTTLDQLHNEAIREVITAKPWGFRQKSTVLDTIASQQFYNLPADCGKVLNTTVLNGTTRYTPKRLKSREEWDRLNQTTNFTSNIPEYYFVFGKTIGFYPTFSSATDDAITINYEREQKDLSITDYTTGNILTATSGSTAIVGTSTSWTAQMAGRYLRISDSDTANKGDGYWYEIASVATTTTLTLVAPYSGSSIAVGSASYTIGQTSIIPEDHQMAPIYRALDNYFSYIKPAPDRAQLAKNDYANAMRRMQIDCGSMAV